MACPICLHYNPRPSSSPSRSLHACANARLWLLPFKRSPSKTIPTPLTLHLFPPPLPSPRPQPSTGDTSLLPPTLPRVPAFLRPLTGNRSSLRQANRPETCPRRKNRQHLASPQRLHIARPSARLGSFVPLPPPWPHVPPFPSPPRPPPTLTIATPKHTIFPFADRPIRPASSPPPASSPLPLSPPPASRGLLVVAVLVVLLFCHVIPYHTMSCHTVPYHGIPYHTMACHTISYHDMACPPPPLPTRRCSAFPCTLVFSDRTPPLLLPPPPREEAETAHLLLLAYRDISSGEDVKSSMYREP